LLASDSAVSASLSAAERLSQSFRHRSQSTAQHPSIDATPSSAPATPGAHCRRALSARFLPFALGGRTTQSFPQITACDPHVVIWCACAEAGRRIRHGNEWLLFSVPGNCCTCVALIRKPVHTFSQVCVRIFCASSIWPLFSPHIAYGVLWPCHFRRLPRVLASTRSFNHRTVPWSDDAPRLLSSCRQRRRPLPTAVRHCSLRAPQMTVYGLS
jgi:hypothetical protein